MEWDEGWGVVAAVLSSGLGGTSIGATRYLVDAIDPLAIGSFRFGIGFLLLLPVALLQGDHWPARRDWPGVAGLGVLYFALFPILFNASLIFTTAARGALALSTLPLLTMVVGAAIGSEALTARKSTGVLIAMLGVAVALLSGLSSAPAGAWRGDLLMVARRALHGALQRLVEAVYHAFRSDSVHHHVDGRRRRMPHPGLMRAWQLHAGCRVRDLAMAGGQPISAHSAARSLSIYGHLRSSARRRRAWRSPSRSIRSRRRWSARSLLDEPTPRDPSGRHRARCFAGIWIATTAARIGGRKRPWRGREPPKLNINSPLLASAAWTSRSPSSTAMRRLLRLPDLDGKHDVLAHIVDAITNPLFVKDEQHRLVVVNDAVLRPSRPLARGYSRTHRLRFRAGRGSAHLPGQGQGGPGDRRRPTRTRSR